MAADIPTRAPGPRAQRLGLWLTAAGVALLLGALVGAYLLLRAPAGESGGARVATAAQAPDPSVASQTLIASPATARPALSDLAAILRGVLICGLVAAVGAGLLVLGIGYLRDLARERVLKVSGDDAEEL